MGKITFKVYVIRPYHVRIREKVFAAIESLGGIVPDGWVASEDATDAEVLSDLRDKRPDVLIFRQKMFCSASSFMNLRKVAVMITALAR